MSGTPQRYRHVPLRVVVVGGGVAALETCFALDVLAGDRVSVTLVASNAYFRHRPVGQRNPLALHGRVRVPLARLANAAGVDLQHDRVTAIDPDARRVYTAGGYQLSYDVAMIATGAVPRQGAAAALGDSSCHDLMRRLYRGQLSSVAFVEPPAPARPFDLYDLAIHAATVVRRQDRAIDLTLVTPESAPLALLGIRAASNLKWTLGAHGIKVVESAYVRSIERGEIELAPHSRSVLAAGVIATPRLGGPYLHHLPCDRDGFLAVDPHGRVSGARRVFAAGDCTSFPVKHPSLAAQQADAAAAAIAADAGCPVAAEPFTPVLRGILPSRLRWYVEAPLTGGYGDATRISATPLWPAGLRFSALFLQSHLDAEILPARRSREAVVGTR